MTPVFQSKLYSPDAAHRGNCYPACLASLLDLPLWMVPAFDERWDKWEERTSQWLRQFFALQQVKNEGHEWIALPQFYIANGPSPRGVHHSVIYSAGQLIHDPHPSAAGLREVEWTWHLEIKGEAHTT